MNLLSDVTRSTVIAVPKSKIRQFSSGKSSAAPRAAAILSRTKSTRSFIIHFQRHRSESTDHYEFSAHRSQSGLQSRVVLSHGRDTYHIYLPAGMLLSLRQTAAPPFPTCAHSESNCRPRPPACSGKSSPMSISRFFTDNDFKAGKDSYNFCMRL